VVVWRFPLLPGAVLAVLFTALVGAGVDRVLVRPVRRSIMAVLILTLVFALLTEQVLYAVYGYTSRNIPAFTTVTWNLFGVQVPGQRVVTFGVAAALVAILWVLVYHTRTGATLLAVAQDPEAALYMGIDVHRVTWLTMAASAALAGAAGVLTAPLLVVSPHMWLLPLVKSFAIVILGGLGSIPGSLLASLLVGYAETAVSYFASSALADLIPLLLILVMLLVRPTGLLGRHVEA
jgi:branched-chain amino acid transport system permease protein